MDSAIRFLKARLTAGFTILFVTAIVFAGCAPQSPSQDGPVVIGMIPKSTAHVFWKTVQAGALTAAQELGVEIEWMGPPAETMKDQQIGIVEDFIAKRVAGIALAPSDKSALVPVVERSMQIGIPVVIFDSGIDTDTYISYVSTDNYDGGVKAAHEMGRLLEGEGTCFIVGAHPGSESNSQRELGFEETIKADYPGIEILEKQFGYSDREKSRSVAEDMLTAHAGVDAIFAPNEPCTYGALLALQARHLAGEITLVGFDATETLLEAMGQGHIDSLVVQKPFSMGYLSVKTMVSHLMGKPIEERIDTGSFVVTPENMNDTGIQALLFPDLTVLDEG